jgi:hypothetical protein
MTVENIIPTGTILPNTSLIAVTKMPGVADLPLKVRGPFAKALIAEANGNHDDADRLLTMAVVAEGA